MSDLGRWSGGVKTQGNLPETWTAPASLFDTEDRNDGSAYSFAAATSTLTLPASGLADGYLIVARYVYDDTSNGRFTIQGKIIQASGTGNLISGPTGGYSRDTSEHLSYTECYAIVDNPSASSTFQFQWQADADDATGGTDSSVIEVIPLYYSNIGMYSSDSAALYGGITPNVITGWTTVLESDTAAIERTTDLFTVKTDDKRYLVFGSQYTVGRGGRTQRWYGLDIDGTTEEAAKAYAYYRTTSNDKSGALFTHLLETDTANRTIEQTCFRGYGILAGEGGASSDGSTPTLGDHTLVIIELNDSAEVFHTVDSVGGVNMSGAGSTFDQVLSRSGDVDIIDSASFTRQTDTQIRVNKADDYLFGANISVAQENQGTGLRWTAEVHLTVNGTEDADTRHGNYMRNSISTLGWSAWILSYAGLAIDDDIGVSVQPIPGGEAGGEPEVQPGWSGFWGINLDTLEETATGIDLSLTDTLDDVTLSSDASTTIDLDTTATLEDASLSSDASTTIEIDSGVTLDDVVLDAAVAVEAITLTSTVLFDDWSLTGEIATEAATIDSAVLFDDWELSSDISVELIVLTSLIVLDDWQSASTVTTAGATLDAAIVLTDWNLLGVILATDVTLNLSALLTSWTLDSATQLQDTPTQLQKMADPGQRKEPFDRGYYLWKYGKKQTASAVIEPELTPAPIAERHETTTNDIILILERIEAKQVERDLIAQITAKDERNQSHEIEQAKLEADIVEARTFLIQAMEQQRIEQNEQAVIETVLHLFY